MLKPRVVTLNNVTAKITNSRNFNLLVNSSTNEGDKSGIQTIGTGVTLKITPSVITQGGAGGKRLVRMEINAENSSLGAIGDDSVTTDEQEVQTNVIIPEGRTFIMGGLFNTDRVESVSGIPGLKDLPWLGQLFRTNASTEVKRETVFLITPKIYFPREVGISQSGPERVYMENQREELDKVRSRIRRESKLLDLSVKVMAEDE